jgi:hypothetical protein
MTIQTTELLDFLCKAQKLSILDVTFRQTDEGYKITLRNDWYDDGKWSNHTVFIDNEGRSDWKSGGDYDFCTMDSTLDEMLVKQQEKEIKAQKRKELIESLTPEQRELLGV